MSTRVLQVISSIDATHGGTSTAVVGLAIAQARAGLDVHVVSTYTTNAPGTTMATTLRDSGVSVELIGPAVGRLRTHPRLVCILRGLVARAQVVHIHGLWEQIQHAAAVEARNASVPYIITPHGMLDPWSLAKSRIAKRLYLLWRLRRDLNCASAIHYTADLEREGARPLRLSAPTIVEPNGLDLSEFADLPAKGTFRSRWQLPEGAPVLLFLGRLHPKKGIEVLLSAAAKMARRDVMLVIAGPGDDEYVANLKQVAERLGLAGRTLWTGMLHGRDRIAAMVDADLFVLPSYQENFGIAVAESLASGTPVVVSQHVAIWREISEAGVGAAVPVEPSRLASELDLWLNDVPRRALAASRAQEFVRSRYDWDGIARRWIGYYESAASGGTTPPVV